MALLSYLLITAENFVFEKVASGDMLNVNTFTSDDKYSLLNRDNLTKPIQMQLPQKQKTFFQFVSAILKFKLNF